MIEDNNQRLTFSAHRVVEEVLIGQSDTVFKFCLVGPAELGGLADVEEFAWGSIRTCSVPFDASLVSDNLCD